MIVLVENHIWGVSNSKISQITTTTTFSARNSDLALILSTWHSLQLHIRRVTGFVPAGKQYWYFKRNVLLVPSCSMSRTRLAPAPLQITRQIRISRNRHFKKQSQNCDQRSLPSSCQSVLRKEATNRTDFHNSYSACLLKFADKYRSWLTPDKIRYINLLPWLFFANESYRAGFNWYYLLGVPQYDFKCCHSTDM
jgi:hypothetical protein